MKANEIRAEMLRNNITVTSIARSENVAIPTVSQVISGARKNPRIRIAIASAAKMQVSELWPEQEQA